MFLPHQYQLLDFGDDEKLESFAGTVVRRETPSGFGAKQSVPSWSRSDLRYRREGRKGFWQGKPPDPWEIQLGDLTFLLRQTASGQVGVFPEQAENWGWIDAAPVDLRNAKALNLFAYTGGTSLALARRGVHVTHVDAAKSVVNWARLNAKASGLDDAPIRWIVEDALTFVDREIRRGNHYDIVVADPPSFGRGPNGDDWKIQRDFPHLMEQLATLVHRDPLMLLISCHTPGIDRSQLSTMISSPFQLSRKNTECFEMSIPAASGNRLLSGICFRASKPPVG